MMLESFVFKHLSVRTVLLSTSFLYVSFVQAQEKKNVLFIIVDDLRPELGCYGSEAAITPFIDGLAAQSVIFQNAYCNVPVSGASRSSLLTGVYPDITQKRFVDAETWSQKDLPGVITLPQAFKNAGYYTMSVGKVFHHFNDRTDSWSEFPWIVSPASGDWALYNKWHVWKNEIPEEELHPQSHRGPYCEGADVPDSCYEDNKIARKAVAELGRLKEKKQPFFLAVGFRKPHLPFIAPQKYWDLYEREDIKIADNRYRSENLPEQVQNSREIFQYTHVGNTSDEGFHREARHAYYACVSFIDTQIGIVLNELKRLNLTDNTIVVLLGDHGWHLGEHDFWGKHTLFNQATHAPFMVSYPGGMHGSSSSIVEFVDIYPSLCEACGISQPGHLQGRSFLPTLKDPKKKHRDHAFIQWGKGVNLVTSDYSYAQWYDSSQNIVSEMLFDHRNDPEENKNVAGENKYCKLIKKFQTDIKKEQEETLPLK
ncbi:MULTISPECIES: sulfatase [Bacteroides]|jgi:iduronate 2-sulfatase|uniref:sulfatase n=1 Tax=Bacteroides TaxID=816 RepID=UPI000C77A925|nr:MULTISPECIES: sulfatase [Bacteroides]RGM49831.1 DUF229 domain-containing protein [Bacteroides sp. OM08-11]